MSNQQGTIIASTKLSEENVRTAIAQFLLKNDEFAELIGDKKVILSTSWQVSKWSDPDAFVHISVVEPTDEVIAVESTEESSKAE
jgi:hypothetical protein